MKFSKSGWISLSVAAVASLTLGVEGASAQLSATGMSCNVANFTGTTDCEGIYNGNDSNTITDQTQLFGKTGWTERFKVDDSSGTTGPLQVKLDNPGDDGAGSWELSEDFKFDDYESVMFVLKGGNSFSSYLSDSQTMAGDWDNDDLLKGNGRRGAGLSHLTVWTTGTGNGGNDEPTPTPVPEPAALLGLGSVALASRFLRRKSDDV